MALTWSIFLAAPLLMTEHVRSLQPHVDFALAEATDYLRGDVGYDGITGVMKLAHAAEGLGLDIEFHGPGLGAAIDWEWVAHNRIDLVTYSGA